MSARRLTQLRRKEKRLARVLRCKELLLQKTLSEVANVETTRKKLERERMLLIEHRMNCLFESVKVDDWYAREGALLILQADSSANSYFAAADFRSEQYLHCLRREIEKVDSEKRAGLLLFTSIRTELEKVQAKHLVCRRHLGAVHDACDEFESHENSILQKWAERLSV